MEKLTPGRKLILDLLAKSVAKIQAAEFENVNEKKNIQTENRKDEKKRKYLNVEKHIKKRIKVEKEEKENYNLDDALFDSNHEKSVVKNETKIKEEYIEKEMTDIKQQPKPLDVEPVAIKVKTEYNESKIEISDHKNNVKDENTNKSCIMKLLKGSIAKYSGETDISSHVKKELDFIKNEDKKENIKVEDNHDVKTSKNNLDNIKPKTISNKVKFKKPVSNNMKKEYTEMNSYDYITENKDQIVEDHEGDKSRNPKHKYFTKIAGKGQKMFTPEEDQILRNAMERVGHKIDFAQIAKDLGRTNISIRSRIDKLKTGNGRMERRVYTLAEDIIILDAVLKHWDEQSLEMLNIPNSEWKEIGALIGRLKEIVRMRWDNHVKPWILQHYSGTLNMNIKRPLANYVADNFKDINSIDWPLVTSKSEFAGHTQSSLRRIFFSCIYLGAKKKLNKSSEDITLEMLADFANTAYLQGGRKVSDSILERQQEIINYFECYVKTNHITNFY